MKFVMKSVMVYILADFWPGNIGVLSEIISN
jgi:hypothetical protein